MIDVINFHEREARSALRHSLSAQRRKYTLAVTEREMWEGETQKTIKDN